MSDQGSEQRTATGSGEGPARSGDRVSDAGSEVRVIVEIGEKLSLVFDASGVRVETVAHPTSLSHDEFDRLTALPLCAIRTALRRGECGQGAYGSWGVDHHHHPMAERINYLGDLLRVQRDEATRQFRIMQERQSAATPDDRQPIDEEPAR